MDGPETAGDFLDTVARLRAGGDLPGAFIVDATRAPGQIVLVGPTASVATVGLMFPAVAREVQAIRSRTPERPVVVMARGDWKALLACAPLPVLAPPSPSEAGALMGMPIYHVPDPSLLPTGPAPGAFGDAFLGEL